MAPQENLFLENQILGCLYGNCIGDAIGLLTEFMTKAEALKWYGKDQKLMLEYSDMVSDQHRDCWNAGDWTDDSDQMILIMDSIMGCVKETKTKKVNAVDFGERLKVWASHGFPELGDTGGFGLGHTTNMVLNSKHYKTDPQRAAKETWERSGRFIAPNGAVMRTSILGIYNYTDLKSVQENCIAIAKVTHADPRCLASCVAVCSAIAFMLQKQHLADDGSFDIEKIILDSYTEATEVFTENIELNSKELYKHMFAETLESLKLDEAGKIGFTYKTLGAGFWALRQKDFRSALTSITMEAGDADTNGAVAGALLGCKNGFEGLPATWLDSLIHKQWLDNKIYRFMQVTMPNLKLQFLHYDASHEPVLLPIPRKAKRQEKALQSKTTTTAPVAQSQQKPKKDNIGGQKQVQPHNPKQTRNPITGEIRNYIDNGEGQRRDDTSDNHCQEKNDTHGGQGQRRDGGTHGGQGQRRDNDTHRGQGQKRDNDTHEGQGQRRDDGTHGGQGQRRYDGTHGGQGQRRDNDTHRGQGQRTDNDTHGGQRERRDDDTHRGQWQRRDNDTHGGQGQRRDDDTCGAQVQKGDNAHGAQGQTYGSDCQENFHTHRGQGQRRDDLHKGQGQIRDNTHGAHGQRRDDACGGQGQR